MNVQEALSVLRNETTTADLNQFADAYKFAVKRLTVTARGAFQPGQNVQWTSSKYGGVVMKGVVVKINPKFTVVKTTMGNWRVAHSMLRAA
jgi:hypothetical protein